MRTAPFVSSLRKRLKVTHPFHPLFDKEFELVGFFNRWKEECVQFSDVDGSQFSLPLDWTDAAGVDPFLRVSRGRSHFRVEELLRLADLMAAMASRKSTKPSEKV